MDKNHVHEFRARRRGSKIGFCDCGRWRFIKLKKSEIIAAVPPAPSLAADMPPGEMRPFAPAGRQFPPMPPAEYQPKTGAPCSCRRGQQRDNCPACEGTGWRIDFAAIRARQGVKCD